MQCNVGTHLVRSIVPRNLFTHDKNSFIPQHFLLHRSIQSFPHRLHRSSASDLPYRLFLSLPSKNEQKQECRADAPSYHPPNQN